MKPSRMRYAFVSLAIVALTGAQTLGQSRESLQLSVDAYTRVLNQLEPGQDSIAIGDMEFSVTEIGEFRDTLQKRLESKITALGNFDFSGSKQWPNGVVPYAYDKSMPEEKKPTFEAGMREWQQVANINFIPRTSQANYILVKFTGYKSDATMSSRVGMDGGAQTLNVANWGNKIDCAHELGHALGLIHEQMRVDRDTYVTLYPTNISLTGADFTVNFALARSSVAKGAYDFDSLMHYGRTAFAIDPKFPTITAKAPYQNWSDGFGPQEIGQKDHLSAGDKSAMADQYGSPLSIEGTVVDAAGHALAGIQVTISGGSPYRGDNPVSTDASGRYRFTGIPKNSGKYTLTPSQTGTSFTESSKDVTIQNDNPGTIQFTSIDSAPPDLKIDVPAISGVYNAAPRASGTASDTVGLKEVRIALARTSDLVWWNWNENTWGTTTFDWSKNVRIATGKTSWSADLPVLPVGGYQVHVQSVDVGDNGSPWRFRHFFVDPEPPTITVSEPVPGTSIPELMHIRGTATDGAGTGIKDGRVYFTLYQDGDFWTGFNWKANTSAQDPDVLLSADVVNGEWIYNSVPGGGHDHSDSASPDERNGLYVLSIFARDNAGNLSQPKPGVNNAQFTVDHTPPSISIASPADGVTLTNLTLITGTSTDSKSLETVRFYLYSFVNGQFWDGNAWGGGGSAILPVSIDKVRGTWASVANLPSISSRNPATRLANGAYNIIAFAVDSAGNQTRNDVIINIENYPQAVYTAGSYSDQDPFNNNENWDNPANWDGGFVPGPGDLAVITSGSPIFGGTKTVHALKMTGGELRGGTLVIPDAGNFTWSGGTLSSDVIIQPGGHLNINGATRKTLASGRRIENNGEALFSGDGSEILGSGNSWFVNNGTANAEGNTTFVYYNNGVSPRGTFLNSGIVNKTGSGILRFSIDYGGWVLTNGAALKISEGSIIVNNDTFLGGTISGAGRLVGEDATLHLDSTTVLDGGNVELKRGTLVGGGTFSGTGTFIWSGGTLAGDITIDANAHGLLAGDARTIASSARLQNRGAIIWESGAIHASGMSRLENSGRLDITGNVAGIYYNNGVSPRGEFENTGLVTVNNGVTALFQEDYGGWHFNNRGETRVVSGKLILSGGGVSSNGTYNVQSGTIELASGEPHLFSGELKVTGAGRMRVTGGYLNGNNATFSIAQEATFEHNTGTAEGTFTVKGPGTYVWSGGTLNASMAWEATLQAQISGEAQKNLEAGRILQAGTVTWTGTGLLRATGGAEFKNTGLFEIKTDSGFVYYNNGVSPRGRFINTGTLRKNTATEATRFLDDYGGWIFINSGIVDVQSGSIELYNSSTLDNGGKFTGAGAVRVISGTTEVTGTNTVDGGSIAVDGGSIAFVSGGLTSNEGRINGPGTFSWSGGGFGGVLNVGVTNFSISGSADKVLNTQSTIRNYGLSSWSGSGPLRFTGASFFENHGRFEVREDTTLFYYNNGVSPRGAVINTGIFVKSGGANSARFAEDYGGTLFDNRGTVSVQSGTLNLAGGGTWENGAAEIADGAELRFSAGRFTLGKLNSFSGKTVIIGGELALADSTNTLKTASAINLAGGTLLGSGSIVGPGTFEWSAGGVAGDLTIAAESHLALTGTAPKQFIVGTINNRGNSSWSGTGVFHAQGGALFNNTGEFTLLSDSAFAYYNNGISPRGRFHNAGVMKKTGTTGESVFADDYGGWDFSNTGVVQIESGVLSLKTGNSFNNATVRGAGRVRLDGGGLTFNGTTKLDGGTFELARGFVDGESTFEGAGTFEWTGGELRGTQTIAVTGKMLLSGAGDKNVGGSSTLINHGTLTWTGAGPIRGVGQSKIVNNGTFDIQNNAAFIYYNNGVSPVGTVENNGVVRKSAGAGRTEFLQDYGGWRFVNSGTLEVRTGTFGVGERFEPGASSRTILRLSGTEAGAGYGSLSYPVPANFLGTLVVELGNGFVPSTNGSFTLATYPSRQGEFDSPALPGLAPGSSWKLDYQATSLQLSVTAVLVAQNSGATYQSGKFQLTLSGPPGQYALLQSTTNLIDWINIQTNQPFTGEFQFSYPNATKKAEFFRTVIVP